MARDRERQTHDLKSWPESFRAVLAGRKRHEVRRDDRTPAFRPGDAVMLHEFDPVAEEARGGTGYTGRKLLVFIGYVDRSECLPDGWCGFDLVSAEDFNRAALVAGRDS